MELCHLGLGGEVAILRIQSDPAILRFLCNKINDNY